MSLLSLWRRILPLPIASTDINKESQSTRTPKAKASPPSSPKQHDENALFAKSTEPTDDTPITQKALLLHGPRQNYELKDTHPVPEIRNEREMLVKVLSVGLNPIDWKAPDFNFGIPQLPYISGRDLVGVVLRAPQRNSRIKAGDIIISISTDYRDIRKAALQQYTISTIHTACRLPRHIAPEAGSTLGVAFVASALALGICLGVDFSKIENAPRGPNLMKIVRALSPELIPQDVRGECLSGMPDGERGRKGDWVAIWGGSSTTAHITTQLAKLAGLRVLTVLNISKHGPRLAEGAPNHQSTSKPDLQIDSHDPERAIAIIRSVTHNSLRLAIDTSGRETATLLQRALDPKVKSHLVGLTGLPKGDGRREDVTYHPVPIKLFHEIPDVGDGLMIWLEQLLLEVVLDVRRVFGAEGEGLEGVNAGLDRMRRGEISGGRLVLRVG